MGTCARILLYAEAYLLLTESFHGNIEKIGWAQIGRQQPLPFAHLERTLQLRKKIIGTWFFGEEVVGAPLNGTQVLRAEVVRQEIVSS